MSLKDKLNKYKEKLSESDEELDNWVNSVEELHKHIEEYLQEYEPEIKVSKAFRAQVGKDGKRRKLAVSRIMILQQQLIQFNPVPSNVLGYKGRVDITIPGFTRDRIQLFLDRIDGEDNWMLKINDSEEGNFSDAVLEKLIGDVIDSKA